jgi:starch synthase (maltosyl-transferring)
MPVSATTRSRRAAARPGRGESPPPRVVIEAVEPAIDGGRFPIKRTVGEEVVVEADVFADGHDVLAAVVRYREVPYGRRARPGPWREAPMTPLGNDRWRGRFVVERLARYQYTVQAWIDRFASWREDLRKRYEAGQDVEAELAEGAALVPDPALAARFASGPDLALRVAAALDEELASAARRADPRMGAVTYEPLLEVRVDRERARFGAWYEMFPRSYTPDPSRSATFDEAAARLPGIAEMGFDVVYLPPIHPIGRTARKGRNNAPTAGPGDPGSPWAIGSEAGGHTAVDPGLGTIEDFERFVARARDLGLEIALDLAFQASPDHPYVREHPEWFRRRPDGTIRYAENPPKRYQDIYPFDFETPAWRALWEELLGIVRFWIDRGVKIFRVDNPHTKPFRFWEWLIDEVRADHPDVIFLSEAFTRPKVMYHLAKLGFQQSYSYFIWRTTKAELTDYFTELTATPVREYFRPNLFTNTPDILHAYLQTGGPPAFRVRLLLAATLGASYGIYSGFEACESRAVRPGSEEYLDSEKYQYRFWDWDAPGNLRGLIARVNRIRREHPALQSDRSLRFHPTDNDQLLCYSKSTPDGSDRILVVVNLDPFNMQHGWVQVPAADWGLPETYRADDLLSGETYTWRGDWNYVRLEPALRPGHVLAIAL